MSPTPSPTESPTAPPTGLPEGCSADLIIYGGRVRTLSASGRVASALAIHRDRIIAVGDDAAVRLLAGRGTRVIDAHGRTVLPGFIDAHTHFQKAALSRAFTIDFLQRTPRTVSEVVEAVRARATVTPQGDWIRGDALDAHQLAEDRFPTRWELDAAAPQHPVALISVGNHNISANSLGLRRAGITEQTPEPPGGRIERTPDGVPTGVLRELGKLRLDPNRPDSVLPTFSLEQRMNAVTAAADHLLANGVTGIHDVVMDPREIEAYMHLRNSDSLHLRIQLLVRGVESRIPLEHITGLGILQGFGDEYLRLGAIKMSVDGTCEERNAAVTVAYPGDPDNFGLVRIPQQELDDAVLRCQQAGLRVAVHAIGPRAVTMALDAIEKAKRAHPDRKIRHRIEHAYLPPEPGQLARMRELGVTVSTQPAALFHNGDRWCDIWPEDDMGEVMPLRSMIDQGVDVVSGTDYPCVPVNPFNNLRAAVTRTTRAGRVLGMGQAITVDEALRMQTIGVARCGGEQHDKGSLEVGKLADIIIVSEDPYDVTPTLISDIEVEMTILGGKVRFGSA